MLRLAQKVEKIKMSVHYVPPRDPNAAQVQQIKEKISQVLNKYIGGRGKGTKVEKATVEMIDALGPLLKLNRGPTKGATIMTEAATRNEYGTMTKGPNNI